MTLMADRLRGNNGLAYSQKPEKCPVNRREFAGQKCLETSILFGRVLPSPILRHLFSLRHLCATHVGYNFFGSIGHMGCSFFEDCVSVSQRDPHVG